MRQNSLVYSLIFQGGILLFLFFLQFILPTYLHSSVSKIMVLSSYAIAYNFLLNNNIQLTNIDYYLLNHL